jgi:energy-coupling factor transport system substrate-specific component
MSFITKVKNDFTLISVLLIPVAVAINFVGGQLAMALKLPIYLDSIGTMLVGLIAGPWVGAATGLLNKL